MKKTIRLTEKELHKLIKESVKRVLRESTEIDPDTSDYENDEEMSWEMRNFMNAMKKANGTYHATSSDGQYQTGDRVRVNNLKCGSIEGVIEDFDTNFMTFEECCSVDYVNSEGRKMTMIGIPLSNIEKI